jgi:hypothetical protein
MVSVVLEWAVIEKKVYNVDTQKTEMIRFLCLNVVNKYNHTMGHVDVADQFRGSYQLDVYIRNRKWWWAIMFWVFGTLLKQDSGYGANIGATLGVLFYGGVSPS